MLRPRAKSCPASSLEVMDCLFVRMHVCVYRVKHLYIYTYMYVYIRICMCMYVCMYVCISSFTHTYMCSTEAGGVRSPELHRCIWVWSYGNRMHVKRHLHVSGLEVGSCSGSFHTPPQDSYRLPIWEPYGRQPTYKLPTCKLVNGF